MAKSKSRKDGPLLVLSFVVLFLLFAPARAANVWFLNALAGNPPANSSPLTIEIDGALRVEDLLGATSQSTFLTAGTYEFLFTTNTTRLGASNQTIADNTFPIFFIAGNWSGPQIKLVTLPVPRKRHSDLHNSTVSQRFIARWVLQSFSTQMFRIPLA